MNTELLESNKPPWIKKYQNALTYLNDLYRYFKQQDPQFSYERWSYQLGFKSGSSLKMICTHQRKITESFVLSFSAQMKFSASEQDYFRLLTEASNAENLHLKNTLEEKALEDLVPRDPTTVIEDKALFLTNLHIPVILMLLSFEDSPGTEEFLAQKLDLSLEKINPLLQQLEQLQFIQCVVDSHSVSKKWISNIKSFQVKDDREAIRKYREQTLTEARQKLDGDHPEDLFKSILIPLNTNRRDELRQDIESFAKKLRNKYGVTHIQEDEIYKINLQLYPVTQVKK